MEKTTFPGPHGPKGFRFTVDSQQFETRHQFITGAEIRQLAGIPADAELYLDMPHGWQDHFVRCEDRVDLGKPGTEKFITLRKKTVIFVNGTPHDYDKEKVSFEEIVELAHVPTQGAAGFVVKYSNGPRQNPKGLMSPGTEVFVRNKMDFNVRSTHQS